jgi:glycosyltransferase involved in cell wall biosynthesis
MLYPHFDKEVEKLNSYKYRGEIVVLSDLSAAQRAEVIGGSYAVVFFSAYEGFAHAVVEAMNCEVPIITCANTSISEIAGEAALYANAADPVDIAEQMKRMYKDEPLRNRLIEAGKARGAKYNWNTTAQLLWEVIEQAVSK